MPVIHETANEPHTSACYEVIEGTTQRRRTCRVKPSNGLEPPTDD